MTGSTIGAQAVRRTGCVLLAVAALLAATGAPAGGQEPQSVDLWARVIPPPDPWIGVMDQDVYVLMANNGLIPAEDVAVTLDVPAGWTVLGAHGDDVADADCDIAVGATSITCTWDEVPSFLGKAYYVTVRSPAGPDAPGTATVTATTSTPEEGEQPNTDSETLAHRQFPASPQVVATPSTGLTDGEPVTIDVIDFPPNTGIGVAQCIGTALDASGCDLDSLSFTITDGTGAASLTWAARRYIVNDAGLVDCVAQACAIAVASTGLSTTGLAPLSFDDQPVGGGPLSVFVGDDPYNSDDGTSAATATADIQCTSAMTVRVRFDLIQVQATRTWHAGSTVRSVPCTPGAPVQVISDLISSMDPGAADLVVRASSGSYYAIDDSPVDIDTSSEALAELMARLADPNDTTVIADLVAGLTFRLLYNPIWARDFWRAILAPPPT